MLEADRAELVDELAEEFARRLRAGERPSVAEYLARCPGRAEELRAVLDAVVMMERMKPRREDAPPTSPQRLGEYRIVREIGRGGMGVVYEAEQEALGRRVALKVLPGHLLADERVRARFRREAQAAARLHHTNIVPVFGSGEDAGQCYYVMQLIVGRGLDRLIRDGKDGSTTGPLTVNAGRKGKGKPDTAPLPCPAGRLTAQHFRDAARIGAQAADALAHAHALGVLHRDIKPSNLIIDGHGTVWVTDFGVAKLLEEADLTQSGDVVGTLRYMPPERFSGVSDARGDVYSLGVTLYELVTLRQAFPDTLAQHLIQLITQTSLAPPREAVPSVPADLDTIIARATARDPAQRYAGAAELAEDLRRFLDGRPILARRESLAEQAWRWCRRNPALAGSLAASMLLMLAITVVSVWAWLATDAARREAAQALASEKKQREEAEDTVGLALDALNRTYESFAPSRLVASAQATEDGVALPAQPSLPPEVVPLLQKLSRNYARIAEKAGRFPRLRLRAAEAYQRLGDIRQRLGQLEEAASAYRDAIQLCELSDERPVVQAARAMTELGRVLRQMDRPDEGEKAIRQAASSLESAPPEVARKPECRFELARSLLALGQHDMMRGPGKGGPPPRGLDGGHRRHGGPPGHDEARRAIQLLKELVDDHPGVPEYLHLLANSYREPGPGGHHGRGDKDGVRLLRQLVKKYPKVPDYKLDLCEALAGGPPGHRGEERGGVDEAIDLSDELARQYPNVPEYRAAHARYLDRKGMGLLRQGRPSDAEKAHREAFEEQTKLVKQFPDVTAYSFWLGLMERSLGRALVEKGETAAAIEHLRSAVARAEALHKKDGRLGGTRPFLGMAYNDLAEALTKAGDQKAAAEARSKATEFGPPGGHGGRAPGRGGPPRGRGPR